MYSRYKSLFQSTDGSNGKPRRQLVRMRSADSALRARVGVRRIEAEALPRENALKTPAAYCACHTTKRTSGRGLKKLKIIKWFL